MAQVLNATEAKMSLRAFIVALLLSVASFARAETKPNLTLGLDIGVAVITDAYLAGISNTVSGEYRGHIGYEHWTGFQVEMILSYASWAHGAPYCTVCKDETVYSVLGGVRYTLPLWRVQPWAEAAIGFGHNWKTAPHSLIGGGIDVLVHEQSIALSVRADVNWFPYTRDRDGGPTDDDWVFMGAGIVIHVD
jgi:hypothetical protein